MSPFAPYTNPKKDTLRPPNFISVQYVNICCCFFFYCNIHSSSFLRAKNVPNSQQSMEILGRLLKRGYCTVIMHHNVNYDLLASALVILLDHYIFVRQGYYNLKHNRPIRK